MRILRYNPKELTAWMALDYFRQRRPLFRWLRVGSWSALLVGLAFVGWSFLPAKQRVYQAGPVSRPHAMFSNNCGACHTDSFQPVGRLWPGEGAVHSVSDQACSKCHPGHDHNQHVPAENCAGCHKEHRGKTELARVADHYCTDCHADLNAKFGGNAPFRNVSHVAAHPEFALWTEPRDPGNVQFNHKKHLELTAESVHEPYRPLVHQLQMQQCNYCHQPEAAGGYMKPINYDNHCAGCHPLQIKAFHDKKPIFQLAQVSHAFDKKPVPHPKPGETVNTVQALLRDRFLEFALKNALLLKPKKMFGGDEPDRPLFGQPQHNPVAKDEWNWAEAQLNIAAKRLFTDADGCKRCHEMKANADPLTLPDLGKPSIPSRWFSHSTFSHKAHQLLTCTACHAGAHASTKSSDVLMPKIATCQSCHGPSGGARSDCAECHKFHQPGGAPNWQGKMDIEECKGN